MATTTIRVSTDVRDNLQELAQTDGISMQRVVEHALELYRRRQILQATNDAYAVLRENPVVWNAVKAERDMWNATLSDGLEEF